MCDKDYPVFYNKKACYILKPSVVIPKDWIVVKAPRKSNTYQLDMNSVTSTLSNTCLFTKASEKDSISWHRRMGHVNFQKMNFLIRNNLVEGVPSQSFHISDCCYPCNKGKQHKLSHLPKKVNSIETPLELLHMDLFGPVHVRSVGGKSYSLVVTDDFSRFSWVFFLGTKSETAEILKKLFVKLETKYNRKIRFIRSDNGTKFKNHNMEEFCTQHGITHQFSAAYTPQQNGVAERKNRTLIECARTMLADSHLPITCGAEAVNTACYTLNRVLIVKKKNKTCYQLLKGRKPNLQHLEPFGAPCTYLKISSPKFEPKSVDGIFLGYSSNSTNKGVLHLDSRIVEEAYNVKVCRFTDPVPRKGPD